MKRITARVALVFCLSLVGGIPALSDSASGPAPSLMTRPELTDYRETTSYSETIDFIRQLQRMSPAVQMDQFGTTGRGRPLYIAVISNDGHGTPERAAASGKPVVLISCGIHSGEICGKEAALMLIRDIVQGSMKHLLDHLVLLVLPVFNVDGHENMSPYNRLNQNGPEGGMGSRANALGFDLNRDFMKLETPEVRAWVENLFTRWWPHLTIDMHTTDGYDHRYAIKYLYDRHPLMPPILEKTLDQIIEAVSPAMREAGYPIQQYGSVLDKSEPEKGFKIWPPYPRLCTSYVATHGRLGLLSEAHAHKDFKTRVLASHTLLIQVLGYVAEHGQEITTAVNKAASEMTRRGGMVDDQDLVALSMDSEASGRTITIEGWEVIVEHDERTDLDCISYSRTPRDYRIPLLDKMVVKKSVSRPAAYIVPPEFGEMAVRRLLRHGVLVQRAVEPFSTDVLVNHVEDISFRESPYQGHLLATPHMGKPIRRRQQFPSGTFIVPMAQAPTEIAALLLEPESADGLLTWNGMNNLTVDPKVREGWVLANIGRTMMNDPDVSEAFRERAEADGSFLEDEKARLNFFWDHSSYPTPGIGDYPIVRSLGYPSVPTETVHRDQW